jgi:adenosylcobyric acid synthase
MIQGTASGVGKSLLTAALCRIFARRGRRVAPFKAQNMALNAAVTPDGREIGRAQAAQADAAGLAPSVDMNPVLLKPEGEDRSQVVVRGVAIGSLSFHEYGLLRKDLLAVITDSLERLRRDHDLVLIEGAGSPAEINLRDGEIVNMRMARLADAPVLLVGDIDRGGVFAAFVGTLELLESEDRPRIAGFIVNKFRGNASLLAPGLDALTRRTGVPVLGVVPRLDPFLVPAEDSLDLEQFGRLDEPAALEIAVVQFPRVANFDDFEPLAREPGVRVRFTHRSADLRESDLIVLPGSKSTIADLEWLRAVGLADTIVGLAAHGRPVLGICGGYQMLGRTLRDPAGVESSRAEADGLGLLPVTTRFGAIKRTVAVRARVSATTGLFGAATDVTFGAYEIHMGTSEANTAQCPFSVVERAGVGVSEPDGAMSADGLVVGTYLHGLFASGSLRRALLDALAERKGLAAHPKWGEPDHAVERWDRLADAVEPALDMAAIARLAGL